MSVVPAKQATKQALWSPAHSDRRGDDSLFLPPFSMWTTMNACFLRVCLSFSWCQVHKHQCKQGQYMLGQFLWQKEHHPTHRQEQDRKPNRKKNCAKRSPKSMSNKSLQYERECVCMSPEWEASHCVYACTLVRSSVLYCKIMVLGSGGAQILIPACCVRVVWSWRNHLIPLSFWVFLHFKN